MHDALLRFWRVHARFDPARGTLDAWLRTITYRLALSRLRAERRRPSIGGTAPDRPAHETAPSAGPLPEDGVLVSERRSILRQLIQTLPPTQRDAVAYAYRDDLSHAEIADRLQVPLGTIKARIRRGLLLLKTQLQNLPAEL